MTLAEKIELAYEAVEEAERARNSLLMVENGPPSVDPVKCESQSREAALRAVKLLEEMAKE